jgi:hypothetical protein
MADDSMYGDGYEEVEVTEDNRPADPDDSETSTALLPQSLCPGMEPGDVLKVRVVATNESDYTVEYVSDDEDEEEEVEEVETETITSAPDEMDAMMA